jgi:hypothetical protein
MRSFAIKRFATNLSLASMLLTGATATIDFNLFAQAVTQLRHQQSLTDAMLRSLFEAGGSIKAANGTSYKNKEIVLNLGVMDFPLSTKTLVENGYYLDQNGWVRRTQDGKNSKASPQDRSFLAAEVAIDAFSFDPGASGGNVPAGLAQNQNFQQVQNYIRSEAYVNPLINLYNFQIASGRIAFLDKSKIYNLRDIESRKNDSSFTLGAGANQVKYSFTRIRYDDSWFVKDPRVISVEITTSTGEKKYRLVNQEEHRLIMEYLNFMKDTDPELAKVLKRFKSEGVDKWDQKAYDLAFEKGVERVPNQFRFENGQWIGFSPSTTGSSGGANVIVSGSPNLQVVSGGQNPQLNNGGQNLQVFSGGPNQTFGIASSPQQFISAHTPPQFINVGALGGQPQLFSVQTANGPISYALLPLSDGRFIFLQPMQAADGSTFYRLFSQPEHEAMINYLRNNSSGQPPSILNLITANPNYSTPSYELALGHQIQIQPGAGGLALPVNNTNNNTNGMGQLILGAPSGAQGSPSIITAAPGTGLTAGAGFHVTNIQRNGKTLVMFYDVAGNRNPVWMTPEEIQSLNSGAAGSINQGGNMGVTVNIQPIAGHLQNPDAKAILLQVLDSQNRTLAQDRVELEQGTSLSAAQALIEAAKRKIQEEKQTDNFRAQSQSR